MKVIFYHPDFGDKMEMDWKSPHLPRKGEWFDANEFFPDYFDQDFGYYIKVSSVNWGMRDGEVKCYIGLEHLSEPEGEEQYNPHETNAKLGWGSPSGFRADKAKENECSTT